MRLFIDVFHNQP